MFCPDCGEDAHKDECLTLEDLEEMVFDSVVTAYCPDCGAERTVEPDAQNYKCWESGCDGQITSPLVRRGFM